MSSNSRLGEDVSSYKSEGTFGTPTLWTVALVSWQEQVRAYGQLSKGVCNIFQCHICNNVEFDGALPDS